MNTPLPPSKPEKTMEQINNAPEVASLSLKNIEPKTSEKPDVTKSADLEKDIRKLHEETDIQSEKIDQEYIKMSRPTLTQNRQVNWDGFIFWIQKKWDDLLWSLYGGDVQEDIQR